MRFAIMALLSGCVGTPTSVQAPSAPKPSTERVAATPAPVFVALAATGSRLDPAVDVALIPEGAWMCDMGTVHFAASDHVEDCPVCGMKMVQKKHSK